MGEKLSTHCSILTSYRNFLHFLPYNLQLILSFSFSGVKLIPCFIINLQNKKVSQPTSCSILQIWIWVGVSGIFIKPIAFVTRWINRFGPATGDKDKGEVVGVKGNDIMVMVLCYKENSNYWANLTPYWYSRVHKIIQLITSTIPYKLTHFRLWL